MLDAIMDNLDWLAAGIGGILGWFFGGLDDLYFALLAFVIIDYATGVIAASIKKVLSSEVGFNGIKRKVTIFFLVGVANVIDVHALGRGSVLRTTAIFFYLSNEGVSILENAIDIGIPIPEVIKDHLLQIKGRGEVKTKDNSVNDEHSAKIRKE